MVVMLLLGGNIQTSRSSATQPYRDTEDGLRIGCFGIEYLQKPNRMKSLRTVY